MKSNAILLVRTIIAAIAIGIVGCAGTGTKTGEYIDDSVITTKVKSAMADDERVNAMNISVTTINGVVHLEGVAHSAGSGNCGRA